MFTDPPQSKPPNLAEKAINLIKKQLEFSSDFSLLKAICLVSINYVNEDFLC